MKTLQDFYDDVEKNFDDVDNDWNCEFQDVDIPDGIFQPFILMFVRNIPGYTLVCNDQEVVFVMDDPEYETCELTITYRDGLLSVCFNEDGQYTRANRKQSQIMASVFAQTFVYWYEPQSQELRKQLVQLYHEGRDPQLYLDYAELPEWPKPGPQPPQFLLSFTAVAGTLAGIGNGLLLSISGYLFGVFELIATGALFGTLAWKNKECNIIALPQFFSPALVGTLASTLSTVIISYASIVSSNRPMLFGERIFGFSDFMTVLLAEGHGYVVGSWLVLPTVFTILLCSSLLPKVKDIVHIGHIGFIAAKLAGGVSETKLHEQLKNRGWHRENVREDLLKQAREFSFNFHSLDRVYWDGEESEEEETHPKDFEAER